MKTAITVVGAITAETPANITVYSELEVRRTPGVNLDDRLRMIPGFSNFRRSSSVVANPTTQGLSLRGIGSSGASRTLVLWDGIPLNDPFGGWVYWTRVDPEEVDRVEVSRGASTSLFGDRAMSGAVALFSRQPARRVEGGYEGGNRGTHSVNGGGGFLAGSFGASAHVRAFTTDGYYIVPEGRRGGIDRRAKSRFVAADTRLDYLGSRDRFFAKLDLITEERGNGTMVTANSTTMGNLGAHYSRQLGRDSISALAYHTRAEYRAAFSTITADRNTERLSFRQQVPSEATGAAGFYRAQRTGFSFTGGADMQRVEGTSTDTLVPTGRRVGGGSLFQRGVYAQSDFRVKQAQFFLGARQQATGQNTSFFSPSAGFAAGRGPLRFRGSAYRSFRAPTLNELYREFRAGNAVTQANPRLRQESLNGAEFGVDVQAEQTRAGLTFYRNELSDLITNVTLSATPALITRQRRNAGAAVSRGIEAEVRRRWRNWTGELSYLFADARVSTRERIAQIPKHGGSAQLGYFREGTLVNVGIRAVGLQFEDDRNTFVLPGFALIQVAVSQRIKGPMSAILNVENLGNRLFYTGFTPAPQIGFPRLWRAGLRWQSR
ncbi:MAG: TonB-dependent receptor [Acidobacteria bacterium]|nr:TonB-dependent receptor [Acidobacteriota bacterium]